MRKVLVGLLTIGLITGCAGQSEVSDAAKREQAFLDTIHKGYPALEDYPEEKLIEAGKGICEFLDDGMTLEEVMEASADAGIHPELMGGFAGAGIPAFCPERQGELYEWIHG